MGSTLFRHNCLNSGVSVDASLLPWAPIALSAIATRHCSAPLQRPQHQSPQVPTHLGHKYGMRFLNTST